VLKLVPAFVERYGSTGATRAEGDLPEGPMRVSAAPPPTAAKCVALLTRQRGAGDLQLMLHFASSV
jgi:hypothetical protein